VILKEVCEMSVIGLLLATSLLVPGLVAQDDLPHPGMLRYPDVSATHVVFSYANDLWVVPREGGVAMPLASPPGAESFPKFSPDGRTVAFTGNYDGVRDLYTLPVEGGIPARVTYHPSSERLCDWTPDGRLVYSASGVVGLQRMSQILVSPTSGGLPDRIPVPYGTNAAISPDGQWLAYTPHSTDSATWKRYRGGMATDIWLLNLKDHSSKRITDWEGSDSLPMWHGSTVYYLTDADPSHRLNIWAYDTGTGKRTQVTHFTDYDVKWPSVGPGPDGGGEIVFQYGAGLYLLNLRSGGTREVKVAVPGARPTLRPRSENVARNIEGWGLSPTAKRAVIQARGDIWTVPAENGPPRNLTRTSGVAERFPAWSPDGRWIAYFSDETGEYELYIVQSDGKGEKRQLTDDRHPFCLEPHWSPDSNHLIFADKAGSTFIHTIESKETKLVDTDPWTDNMQPSWSSDSRWIAYQKTAEARPTPSIWLYNVESGEKHQITHGMFAESSPVFDRKGDYLFYKANLAFQPMYASIGSDFIYTQSERLLAIPLRVDVKYPWLPESDEESWKDEEPEKGNGEKPDKPEEEEEAAPPDKPADPISGAWSGTITGAELPAEGFPFTMTLTLGADNTVSGTIEAMGESVAITSGTYDPAAKQLVLVIEVEGEQGTVTATVGDNTMTGTVSGGGMAFEFTAQRSSAGGNGDEGDDEGKDKDKGKDKEPKEVKIDLEGIESRAFLLPIPNGSFGSIAVNDKGQLIYGRSSTGSTPGIKLFDLKDKKKQEKQVVAGAMGFVISADGKKLLVGRGPGAAIHDAAPGSTGKPVSTSGMTAIIDPREEWRQIFNDAWRIMRDFFYDPNMHGVDWAAVRDHYAPMVEDCVDRQDLNYVIGEMIGELNVGHAYVGGGDTEREPGIGVGMLGVDFGLENGAYRIADIYGGAPWDADARGPLSRPGVDVKEGDYLLAVNGKPLDTSKDPWAAFQGLAGQTVTLTVSEKPEMGEEAREVLVEPMSGDRDLRYRAWIEENRRYVEEKTNARVGYIYVPNTGVQGQSDLVRQLLGQMGKEALIIDERWNGGGQIPNRFIELLNRPVTNYWARRDGNDWIWPMDSHQGPKCMLINGLAGSGGDAFPAYFRKAGLGKLIGTRTWGGLIGLSGNPRLIDGGYMSVPRFAYYDPDGTWGIEGHGVDPDIYVLDDPALMVNGEDPQLDAAIANMLEELKLHPFKPPKRPDYVDRSGMGIREQDK
jgi:tricorn protease